MHTFAKCLALTGLFPVAATSGAQPLVDHHQHLLSPMVAEREITATTLIDQLDAAGIERAVVLSVAYQFGNPNRPPTADEYQLVKAENDWTSREVAQFPERLRGFCSFNPLKDYALVEAERCATDPQLHYGIKLHFGNSDVNVEDRDHVERLRAVFRSANDHQMAIAVHLHPSVNMRRPYGQQQARVFAREILPAAPSVPVLIAHLAGAGGYDSRIDDALSIFIDAIAASDPAMTNVYFDVSGVAGIGEWSASTAALVAARIRDLGLPRVVYGSDASVPTNTPAEAWERFRGIPLSDSEFRAIEENVAPLVGWTR